MAVVDTFLYPRTIAVTRPAAHPGVGFQPAYAADQQTNETAVVSGVPCSIQLRREGQKTPVGLPGDTTDPIYWVFIPLEAGVTNGTIQAKDIVTDELGGRFTVVGPYWDSLGWRLSVSALEA